MITRSYALALILLPLLVASASATPLVWTLTGVTFTDGGTASGSFMYDPATNTYSNVNITTTTGSVRTGATYHFVSGPPNPPSGNFILQLTVGSGNLSGTPAFALVFTGLGLTNSGGTVSVLSGLEAFCNDAVCSGPAAPSRTTTAGSVVGSATPTSGAPALSTWGTAALAILLMGLGWFRTRGSASV